MRLLGSVAVGANANESNETTAVPFATLSDYQGNGADYYLLASGTGCFVRTSLKGSTPSADANDFPLGTTLKNFRVPAADHTIDIYNNTGGALTVQVWAD